MNDLTGMAISARGLCRSYRRGSEEIHAVREVSLDIEPGQFVTFTGPSGSGKTTLVNLLGCLDNPTRGDLRVEGQVVCEPGRPLSEAALTAIRRDVFGYIFQQFHLIPTLTVRENVALPLAFHRKPGAGLDLGRLLRLLGLEHRADHRPGQLSGGEMQRVAIARALVNRPRILVADEPTGNLDSARAGEIGEVLRSLNRDQRLTVVLVTHNPALAGLGDRRIEMRDGRAHEA